MKKFGLYMLIIGLVFTVCTFRESVAANRRPVDLYAAETNVSDIGSFDMIRTDIYAVLDVFATSFKTSKGNITSKSNCYIIPAFNGDETYYIGIKVNDNSYTQYDKIMDETYEYLMGYTMDLGETTVEAQGFLKKMDQKTQDLYYDWFRETEWFDSEEEMQKYALPVYINTYHEVGFFKYAIWIGIALMVIGASDLIIAYSMENRKVPSNMGAVEIYGKLYAKSSLQNINNYVQRGELEYAAQDLSILTGMSNIEAQDVVQHWSNYYI